MSEKVTPITKEPKYVEIIQRWEALWSLESIGRPLWILPSSPVLTVTLAGTIPFPQLLQDKETQFLAQKAVMAWRENTDIRDDFVPHMQPQGGVTVFASAFGCHVDFFEHTLPWAHPVILPEDPPEKVYELQPPAVTDGQLGQMLEFTDYYVEQTRGRYAMAMTDLQGPLDTAYLVWEPSAFMVAMYDHPKEVHHLMRMVTDLIIKYVKEQRSRSPEFLPCHYPPLWLPDGRGIAISDDGLAVVSPKLYQEFCLPYVNELSEEFGGIMIHSCGNFVHQFDNLERVHELRGINFGATETPFEAVWERFGGKTAVIPHIGLNNEIHFDGNREFLQHVLTTKTHDRGLCICVAPGPREYKIDEPDSIAKFVKRVEDTFAEFG